MGGCDGGARSRVQTGESETVVGCSPPASLLRPPSPRPQPTHFPQLPTALSCPPCRLLLSEWRHRYWHLLSGWQVLPFSQVATMDEEQSRLLQPPVENLASVKVFPLIPSLKKDIVVSSAPLKSP